MNTRRAIILAGAFVLLSLAASAYAYPLAPDRMVTHWDAAGEPDGTAGKLSGLFLVPAITVGTVALLVGLPRIDPRKENYEGFRGYYDGFVVVMAAYLTVVHLAVVGFNLGYDVDVSATVIGSAGFLIYYVGVLIEHAKPNWFVGVRTPWTLSDDAVWEATHRIGARLFKLSGVVALLGLFFSKYALYLLLGPVLVSSAITVGYSYYRYRNLGDGGTAPG